MDLLLSYPGWESVGERPQVTHHERSDILDALIPVWMETKRNLRQGESPLWISSLSGGIPGLQLISNGLLTPSFVVFALIDDDALGFYFAGIIKLILAASGMFLFLRLFLNGPASLFGGAVFMLIGFHSAWFFWPHVSTSALIPWLLWCTAAWMLSYNHRWLFGITLSGAFLILGGFPSVAAYGFYTFTLLLLIFSIHAPVRDWFKTSLAAGFAVFLSFLITSLPLLAQIEFLSFFDLGYRTGGTPLSWPDHFRLFFDPYALGQPRVEFTLYSGKIALLLALVSLAVWAPGSSPRLRVLFVFGMAALGISLVLAFGIAPHRWILALPGVGTSLWSRLSIISGLAVAILGALGLQMTFARILRIRNQHVLATALLSVIGILAAIQVWDQMRLFRTFNATVPSEWFLPSTPSLDYVQRELGTLDWVIADNAFLVSGTLGSYGIPEWFAHSFKTSAEKEALRSMVDEPFASPTAATFPWPRIKFGNDILSAFGIRYALISATNYNHREFFRQPVGALHRPAPPLPENALQQHFHLAERKSLSAIAVLLATYHAPEAPSDLILTVFGADGEPITEYTIEKSRIRDNREVLFEFPMPIELDAGQYSFTLELKDPKASGNLTAWMTDGVFTDNQRLTINGEAQELAIRFALKEPATADHGWLIHRLEPSVIVLENPNNPGGAYYVKDLEQFPDFMNNGEVESKRHGPTRLSARYHGDGTGFVVFPMRHYPGWRAYVDGRERELSRFREVLPAVAVKGSTAVELRYRPTFILQGLIVTISGILGLLLLRRFRLKSKESTELSPSERIR